MECCKHKYPFVLIETNCVSTLKVHKHENVILTIRQCCTRQKQNRDNSIHTLLNVDIHHTKCQLHEISLAGQYIYFAMVRLVFLTQFMCNKYNKWNKQNNC